MPEQHNHSDRGVLHSDCAACNVVAKLMSDAGVDPAQVRDYRREPVFATNLYSSANADYHDWLVGRVEPPLEQRLAMHVDDIVAQHIDVTGTEMGNKAVVDENDGKSAELNHLNQLLARFKVFGLPYGVATQIGHIYIEHEHFLVPLDVTLVQAQEIHAGLHHMRIGHTDAPDHFVERFPDEVLKTRQRALAQHFESKAHKALRAGQHERRERAARASREAVMVDSARSLRRAIEHTRGTVMPRVLFESGAEYQVQLKVGVKDRITVAAATIGGDTAVGTAICHPDDRFDCQVGEQLAIARALIALGTVHELEWMIRVAGEHR